MSARVDLTAMSGRGARGGGRFARGRGGRRGDVGGGIGGSGGGRGGGGGDQRWGDPAWRNARLAKLNAQRTPFNETDVRGTLATFVNSSADEELLDCNYKRSDIVRLQAITQELGLFWCVHAARQSACCVCLVLTTMRLQRDVRQQLSALDGGQQDAAGALPRRV